MTDNYIEQLKIETLFHRAQNDVKKHEPKSDLVFTQELYKYTDGEVQVLYNLSSEDDRSITYEIRTDEGYSKIITQHYLKSQKDPY
ncbi:hypothetical protein [Pontibacillus sp. HN14]|uniref:hypothetical protein n=1 Tax=Pontibacillus sp. HN14 TaxID=2898421 RepID=UPI001E54C7C3|nr:hypothetical protein [Pontibacillus sp. HN14]MCD5323556.1 hypothetical protein [Pontibacillus sp. HN14]